MTINPNVNMNANPNPPAPKAKGRRLWFLVLVALLAGGGLLATRLQTELDGNLKAWAYSAITLLGGILFIIWFLLLSRFPGRTRLIAFGVLVLAIVGVRFAVRVDGTVDGSGLPKLTWKWSQVGHRQFANPAPASTAEASVTTSEVADLKGVDVPQFYGPNRDGVVTGASLARDWNAHPPKELWRQPIGEGWSAFAVVGGRAFTQEQRGDDEMVTCYELLTGRLLWSHVNKVRFTQWQGGTGPRATPTVVDGKVYAYGATGILDCLDARNGARIWSRDVLKEHDIPNIVWGISASPLVYDDQVVVTGGEKDSPAVLSYHRLTGEPLWKAGESKASYASPLLATLAGRRVVLSNNASALTVHDAATGALLLNHAWGDPRWPKASQPLVVGPDQIFLSAGYGMGCEMIKLTPSADGKALEAEEIWRSLRMKTQFNSAALRDELIYGLDDGQMACVDITDGKRLWKTGRYGAGQSLLVDDLAIVQTEPGPVVLLELTREEGKEKGRLPALSAKTWNHPTLAGKYLLVRNSEEAVCYELPLAEPKVAFLKEG